MKKIIIAAVMLAGVAGIAFASMTTNKKKDKAAVEKKVEKKKKECRRSCIFS